VREDDTPVPSGGVGELYVRGRTVMRGYWRDLERTAAVLVPDPTRPDAGALVYRTGDLVREDDDGNFLFLGRKDNQIKSRGYRIELGEIETALLAHPAVVECAVTAIPDDVVTNRIKAFVVPDREIDALLLVRFLRERLPQYMVPESFDFLDNLPKTSTGKTDRQGLAAKAGASA
jgi:L-proline---[L-prolyl-carrier protein] ligase